jgi:hypothetical protein
MRSLIAVLAFVLGLTTLLLAGGAGTCFYKSEKDSGTNKICFYSCAGGDAAITVKGYQLCPLTIKQ